MTCEMEWGWTIVTTNQISPFPTGITSIMIMSLSWKEGFLMLIVLKDFLKNEYRVSWKVNIIFKTYRVFYNKDVAQHDFLHWGMNHLYQVEQKQPSSHPSKMMAQDMLHHQTCLLVYNITPKKFSSLGCANAQLLMLMCIK